MFLENIETTANHWNGFPKNPSVPLQKMNTKDPQHDDTSAQTFVLDVRSMDQT
jgi:hypothetical protein